MKYTKEQVEQVFKGSAKDLMDALNMTSYEAYAHIKEYGLKILKSSSIIEDLVKQDKTVDEIASITGLSLPTIYTNIKRKGLKPFKQEKEYSANKETLAKLYLEHHAGEISEMYNVSRQTICNWLSAYGITKKRGPALKLAKLAKKDTLLDLYKEFGSVRIVSDILNLKPSQVVLLLKHYDIERKCGPKPKIEDEDFVNKIHKHSYSELSQMYGVSIMTIARKVKALNITKRVVFDIPKDYLEKNLHKKTSELAKEIGCSLPTISNYLKKYGLKK